jgi:protein O-GlcNAc transferase
MSDLINRNLQEAFSRFSANDHAAAEKLCDEVLRQAERNPAALHLKGLVRLFAGDSSVAIQCITRALESNPTEPGMVENLGVAYLAAGNATNAETQFRRALALGAAHGLLHMRLGLALAAQRRFADAAAALGAAARVAPNEAEIQLNLGNVHAELGAPEAARAAFERAAALQPSHAGAHYNLGTLHQRAGRYGEAETAFTRALQLAPRDPDVHNNLGLVYDGQGRQDDAVRAFEKALALNSRHVAARTNLGNVRRAQGRLEEAAACLQQAMDADPAHGNAYVSLGNVRADEARYAEARALYEQALRISPRDLEASLNLGRTLVLEGRSGEALARYHAALAACGPQPALYRALGHAARDRGDLAAAETAYRSALDLSPADVDAALGLAETAKLGGRLDEALRHYEQAAAAAPAHAGVLAGLTHVRQHVCAWDGIDQLWSASQAAIARGAGAEIPPFNTFSMPTTAAEQLKCAKDWAAAHYPSSTGVRSALRFDFTTRPADSRIRVGYLSWGFHRHATAFLTAELFELHDRSRFEIAAYAYGPDDRGPERSRIAKACDRFVDISALTHADAARKIYDDGVDILVDLTGYTLGARPQILALRPAPVQVSWLGYPGTMGAGFMDYLLADAFIIPPTADEHYSERVVRLPGCYQVTDRQRGAEAITLKREDCGLPADGFVFCCFNQSYKISPETFASWMRILGAVPGSVLWLAAANVWAAGNLRAEAARHHISPDRLIFAPRKPLAEYLAAYRLADLALDTFPYTSHTTASDSLWMGCPLVTMAGETFAARVAGSILTSAGLASFVTQRWDAYESLAIALATDPPRLRAVKQGLVGQREKLPIFDTERSVAALEAAFVEMHKVGAVQQGPK